MLSLTGVLLDLYAQSDKSITGSLSSVSQKRYWIFMLSLTGVLLDI